MARLARTRCSAAEIMSRDGAAHDQQHAGGDQQHGDDVGADALEEGRAGPVEDLAEGAAVLGEERGVEELLARAVGARGPAVWAASASSSPAQIANTPAASARGEGSIGRRISPSPASPRPTGNDDRAAADRVGERRLGAVADRAAVPAQVDDVAEVDRERDAAEAEQVHAALARLLGARPSGPRRAPARGLRHARRARSCRARSSAPPPSSWGRALRGLPLGRPEKPVCKHPPNLRRRTPASPAPGQARRSER